MNYPIAPLLADCGGNASLLAERAGVPKRAVERWKLSGVPESRADAVAVALGLVPIEVWPEWVEHAEAERRRKHAAAQRRWRAKNRERINARERERRAAQGGVYEAWKARQWRQRNPDRVREYQRAYYAANRERILERQRAYDRERARRSA